MLTGSAITRALVIVVLAAGLAGLWQVLMPRTTGTHVSEPPKVDAAKRAEPARSIAPAGESGDPVRSVYPGSRPADPPAPRQPPVAEAAPAPAPVPPPSAAPVPAPAPSPPPVFTPAAPSAPLPQVDTTADAPAAGTVNLNTASLAELNGLGGGMIGKAIIAKRPYASPGELLSKRVLSRATYEKIKSQVTAR
ncbi:helix-hairpin-helix domain-containing protein [Methylobacterium terricola]|uniref:Helix-hairpin-helix domain-containing protein n=1 Tax=Methylobacterium terricola TaxID=2583531 RepID=A0A5C4LDT3_9HYPH|nr:helix-hairpin-helix domain-containing protein [Methylobacterium terricola]TNC11444.1 helix-hairpin-helix domain-containing protein [Methylobacterium terricola]